MLKKRISQLLLLAVLLVAFSCQDNDAVSPTRIRSHELLNKRKPSAFLFATRTIYIHGKKQNTTEQADVYYQINGNGWNYIGTLNGACNSLGSFQANDGDIINLGVMETSNNLGVGFWINEGSATCPTSSLSTYCMEGGWSDYSYEVSQNATLSITARAHRVDGENILYNCFF